MCMMYQYKDKYIVSHSIKKTFFSLIRLTCTNGSVKIYVVVFGKNVCLFFGMVQYMNDVQMKNKYFASHSLKINIFSHVRLTCTNGSVKIYESLLLVKMFSLWVGAIYA